MTKRDMEYQLANFKAFPASGTIPIRPITLIYGPNSSGKSSVLQSLLLLKQTLEEAESAETLLLPKGNLVDLGGYREFVHRHETGRPFSFQLMLPVESVSRLESGLHHTIWHPSEVGRQLGLAEIGLKVSFGYDEAAASAVISRFDFFAGGSTRPFATFRPSSLSEEELALGSGRIGLRAGRTGNVLKGVELDIEHPVWRRIWSAEREAHESRYGAARDELAQFRQQLEMLEEIEAAAAEPTGSGRRRRRRRPNNIPDKTVLLDQIRELELIVGESEKPWEEAAQDIQRRHSRTILAVRNFLPLDASILPEGRDGEAARRVAYVRYYMRADLATRLYIETSLMLRRFIDDLVYLGPLRESPERHYVFSGNVAGQVGKTGRLVPDVLFKNRHLLEVVNEQLKAFDIGYELVITGAPSGELNDVFSIRLVDRQTRVSASILDVGFGISQVLPVIVQSMLSNEKVVCIEQPEIHLHPRLQADLGSLIVTCTRPPFNNQFIIETHSQHILLRIQRLIREHRLASEDVSVLYVDKDESGSRCLQLRLDDEGHFIDEWPGGFFEEGYAEMFGL